MTDVRHPSPQADPVVSYGLVALSLAMQAKAGRLTDPARVAEIAKRLEPVRGPQRSQRGVA